MKIDEESEKKNDILRAVSKAQAEIQLWKSKFETEGLGRIDELEGLFLHLHYLRIDFFKGR